MELSHIVILAVVEGITEFLPISSTGHMILISNLLGIASNDFVKSFEIIIQLGAISAVVFLYWRKLLQVKTILPKLVTAFIPTAIVGLIFYPFIKQVLLGSSLVTVITLFIGGIILIVLEKFHEEKAVSVEKVEDISYKNAFIIGVFQSISVVPGVSRAAATIIGGLLVNTKRRVAVEFSFMLAIPTMLAATGLDLVKSNLSFSSSEYYALGIGLIVSFLVAIVSIRFLLKFIESHTFIPFGAYRIVLAILYFLFIIKI